MQFPVRSTNERKLRSRYGNHLLRQATSGVPHQRKPIYERLATLASLTGLVVGFMAALGFPAATLQFTHLGIPIEMLSYGRSLRAGIMPTAALIIGSIALLGIGKWLSRTASNLVKPRKRRRIDQTNDEKDRPRIPTNIGSLIYYVWFTVFAITTWVTFIWWPFVISRYIGRNFGFIWALASLLCIAVAALILPMIFVRWSFSRGMRRRKMSKQLSKERATQEDAFELPIVPFLAGYMALFVGAWHLLDAYTLQQVLHEFGISIEFLTIKVLLLIGAFFGLIAGGILFAAFSLPAFASKNPLTKRLAWAEIVTYTLVAYLALVIIYSTSVYWRMPDSIGGGRPQPVSIWIDSLGSQLDLNSQLPQAKCTLQGQQWMCTSAYLLDATGETLILVDSRTPNANSLVIPQREVQALTKGGSP
jgi:hypothetical protein